MGGPPKDTLGTNVLPCTSHAFHAWFSCSSRALRPLGYKYPLLPPPPSFFSFFFLLHPPNFSYHAPQTIYQIFYPPLIFPQAFHHWPEPHDFFHLSTSTCDEMKPIIAMPLTHWALSHPNSITWLVSSSTHFQLLVAFVTYIYCSDNWTTSQHVPSTYLAPATPAFITRLAPVTSFITCLVCCPIHFQLLFAFVTDIYSSDNWTTSHVPSTCLAPITSTLITCLTPTTSFITCLVCCPIQFHIPCFFLLTFIL